VSQTPPALEKRRQPGRIRAIILAVAVHAAFFALIVFGITWQSRPEAPVEAELWKDLPPVTKAQPRPPDPEPEPPKPEPPPPEPPKAEPPKPAPPPEPPKVVKPEPPKPDAAIAEKKEREKREREKKEREKEKAEKEKRERLEREAEKKKQDDARKKLEDAKKAQDDAKKKREDEKRRADEEKAKREADKAREAVAAVRQSEMDRYVNGIKAKVRGKANVPDTVTGKPVVVMRIRILPGGEVLDATIERSSGNRVYDAAIERAVRSASPLPVPPADSELFPQFRDLRLNIEHDR
jgi:colicin import membrane protein